MAVETRQEVINNPATAQCLTLLRDSVNVKSMKNYKGGTSIERKKKHFEGSEPSMELFDIKNRV